MSVEEWATTMGTIAAFTAIIVQTVKILWIDAWFSDGLRRDTAIRVLNYLVNLVLVLAVVFTKGLWDPNQLLFYLMLAGGGWVGAHIGQQTLSIQSQPKPKAPTNVVSSGT